MTRRSVVPDRRTPRTKSGAAGEPTRRNARGARPTRHAPAGRSARVEGRDERRDGTRPPRSRALPELEAEQEIDLGRYGRRLARRWWLLVVGLVIGGLIGWIFSSTASSDVNRAEATIYLGQPISASGGSQVPSVQTNSAAVREIARSEEVVGDVAEQVDVDPRRLRAGISTSQVSGAVARTGQPNQLFEIAVRGPWPRRTVAQATNLLAAEVVERTSAYADTKIVAYEARLEELDADLEAAEARVRSDVWPAIRALPSRIAWQPSRF